MFVWQGLTDGAPDVDAIYRLTHPAATREMRFAAAPKRVTLGAQVLCPFNTQNTWWVDRGAFPFLYLPCTVSSRVCDILKSYVAQHCVWRQGGHLGFTEPTTHQQRNQHDLLADFQSEHPMYLHVAEWNRLLASAAVRYDGTMDDLATAYRCLAAHGMVQPAEVASVEEWLIQMRARLT